jgi:2-aminoethylphosphonate-pyruvate transaminase
MSHPPDKLLFTPGPLTTSASVKQAMQRDLGSRDAEFIEMVGRVHAGLLDIAGVSKQQGFESVLLQGSGTFGLEAVVGCALPRDGKLLVASNGVYGTRFALIAEALGIDHTLLRFAEDEQVDPARVDAALAADSSLTHVSIVHCETSTGMLNPVAELCRVAQAHGRISIVDSMSAFGGVPIDLAEWGADFLVSSSNKCIEGVPGFAFVVCRREALLATEGQARSLSFDLLAQWRGIEKNGQFRFTPPTHAILAFDQALRELEQEGGVAGRAKRYAANHRCLLDGMRAQGFDEYLPEALQGPIITAFRYLDDDRFDFDELYRGMSEQGFVIYPGKLSEATCFRIGSIGRIDTSDVTNMLDALKSSLEAMGVRIGAARGVERDVERSLRGGKS